MPPPAAIEAAETADTDSSGTVRRAVALCEDPTPQSIRETTTLLHHQEPAVRHDVALALLGIGREHVWQYVLPVLKSLSEEEQHNIQWLIDYCGPDMIGKSGI